MAKSWFEPTSWLSPRNTLNAKFDEAQRWAEEELKRRAREAGAWAERNVVRPAAKAFDGAMTNVGQGQMYQAQAYRDVGAAAAKQVRNVVPRLKPKGKDAAGVILDTNGAVMHEVGKAMKVEAPVLKAVDRGLGAPAVVIDAASEIPVYRQNVANGMPADEAALRAGVRVGVRNGFSTAGGLAGGALLSETGPGAALGVVGGSYAGGKVGDWASDPVADAVVNGYRFWKTLPPPPPEAYMIMP